MKKKTVILTLIASFSLLFTQAFSATQVGAVAVEEGGIKTRRILCEDNVGTLHTLDVPQTTTDYTKACKDAGYKVFKGFATTGSAATSNCPDTGDCAAKTAFGFNCGGANVGVTENVGISCLFITVINFMSVAVGLAVVGGVTVGGIMYSTSGGSPGKTQQGVKIIVNSLIGLVLWLLLWAIIQFLIPGGVFKS